MNLKSDTFELEINRDYSKRGRANQYYTVKLISGEWPSDNDLITYCDNGRNSLVAMHFGGVVKVLDEISRSVTVYVD